MNGIFSMAAFDKYAFVLKDAVVYCFDYWYKNIDVRIVNKEISIWLVQYI